MRITLHAVGLGPRGQLTRTMSLRFLQFEMSRCGMASLVFLKMFPNKDQFGIDVAPWERFATGTFEVLLQAGTIWQSDMGGPNSLTWGMCQFYLALWNFRSVFGDVNFYFRIPHQTWYLEGFSHNFIKLQ